MKKLQFLLSCVFPVFCIRCGNEGDVVCDICIKKVRYIENYSCIYCHRSDPRGRTCDDCVSVTRLDSLVYPFIYDHYIQRLLHSFKYDFVSDVGNYLHQYLCGFLEKMAFPFESDFLCIPVPLHARRYRERMFNQAEILADAVCRSDSIHLALGCLTRVHYTKPQVRLSSNVRQSNVRDAFWCPSPDVIVGRKILLIDDVYTTGATMQACVRVLKNAGAEEVHGLVFARAR